MVSVSIADLTTEPKFLAERASQLLFGELLVVQDERDGYLHVSQTDGYSGWVQKSLVELLIAPHVPKKAAKFAIVRRHRLRIPDPPYLLLYGTQLTVDSVRSGKVKATLANGSQLTVPQAAIITPRKRTATEARKHVVREAKRFLGVPYLWGGLSPNGCDCSGLVQAVYKQIQVTMPRDTKDQISEGREVARDSAQPGDLLFFKRHVGIVIAPNRIIHSSYAGGGVSINDLTPNGRFPYRDDLDREFQIAKQVIE